MRHFPLQMADNRRVSDPDPERGPRMTAPTRSLLDQSDRTRRHAYKGKQRDPMAAMPAEMARREFRRTLNLIRTAVSMAAAERKRHGRECPPEMRRDAAQDVAIEMAATVAENVAANTGRESVPADRFYPIADLIDQDRPRTAGPGGERITDRPNRDLIALAGSHLDRYLGRECLPLTADQAAGSGATLIDASAMIRDAAETRRSVAEQVEDPTVSPVSADVEEAADAAGLWPDDPARHALRVAVTGDADDPAARHGMTAGDWSLIDAAEYAGRSAESLRKRVQRGRDALEASPLQAQRIGRGIAQCLAVTDIPDPDAETIRIETMTAASPDGPGSSSTLLRDPAWRVNIDQDASETRRKSVPRKRRRKNPPMPAGWRRDPAYYERAAKLGRGKVA